METPRYYLNSQQPNKPSELRPCPRYLPTTLSLHRNYPLPLSSLQHPHLPSNLQIPINNTTHLLPTIQVPSLFRLIFHLNTPTTPHNLFPVPALHAANNRFVRRHISTDHPSSSTSALLALTRAPSCTALSTRARAY
ncbi:hypothetical protein HBI64_072840 [Parastagonospora nodorum]|nr:hypothetical protein HBI64_072840 [Parastagonospora nodorum]